MPPLVAILMGSDSDRPVMEKTGAILTEFGVEHTTHVLSAHRRPDALRDFVISAEAQGYQLFIAAAGGAAALPGAVKALSALPVIGVPLASSEIGGGLDALYSIVQMPPGAPVATVAVGAWGARNAAYLAIEILALSHPDIQKRYAEHRRRQAAGG